MTEPHMLRVTYDDGYFTVDVDCPHAHLGAGRPCAVWADETGDVRIDECSFQQYADAEELEDWLHGRIAFPPVPIDAGDSGDNFHAVALHADGA